MKEKGENILACITSPSIQISNKMGIVVQLVRQVRLFCDPMDCSTPGFPVLHHLLELAQTHVH